MALCGPTAQANRVVVVASLEPVGSGVLDGRDATRQVVGGGQLVEDDHAVTHGRSDDPVAAAHERGHQRLEAVRVDNALRLLGSIQHPRHLDRAWCGWSWAKVRARSAGFPQTWRFVAWGDVTLLNILSYITQMIERYQVGVLLGRLREPRRFLQVVAGPRQVGKTTLVRQALERLGGSHRYASADDLAGRDRTWIAQQWELARLAARDAEGGAVLVLDEVQKVPGWSEVVKRLWDEDTASRRRAPGRRAWLVAAPCRTRADREPGRPVRADPR